jgi:hypothetical protein
MRRLAASIFFCSAMLLLSGCAGYRLGPTGGHVAGEKSIQLQPFANKTIEPRLNENLMISLRKHLMQDGTFRVNTHNDADIILTGTITRYERSGISVQPGDVLTLLDYQISMTVQMVAKNRLSGDVLFTRPVQGTVSLRSGSDLTSAERQAIPQLTDNLAKIATQNLVDGSW